MTASSENIQRIARTIILDRLIKISTVILQTMESLEIIARSLTAAPRNHQVSLNRTTISYLWTHWRPQGVEWRRQEALHQAGRETARAPQARASWLQVPATAPQRWNKISGGIRQFYRHDTVVVDQRSQRPFVPQSTLSLVQVLWTNNSWHAWMER